MSQNASNKTCRKKRSLRTSKWLPWRTRLNSLDKSCKKTSSNNNNKCNFNNNKLKFNNSVSTKCTEPLNSSNSSPRMVKCPPFNKTHLSSHNLNGNNNSNSLWIWPNRRQCHNRCSLPQQRNPNHYKMLLHHPRRACSWLHLLSRFPKQSHHRITKQSPKKETRIKSWRTWKSSWRSLRLRGRSSIMLSLLRLNRRLLRKCNRRNSQLLKHHHNNSRIYKQFNSCKLHNNSNSSHRSQTNTSKWTNNKVKHRKLNSELVLTNNHSLALTLNIPSSHNNTVVKWCISDWNLYIYIMWKYLRQ